MSPVTFLQHGLCDGGQGYREFGTHNNHASVASVWNDEGILPGNSSDDAD